MIINSKYSVGDKVVLLNGEVATIRGVHIYIGLHGRIGYQLHIGNGVFIKEKDIKYYD